MKPATMITLSFFLLAAAPPWLPAQTAPATAINTSDPQQVLAWQGDAVLTQAAIDGAFSRIPERDRLQFVRNGAQVDQLVKSLLQAEVVALDAEKSGFSNDPVVVERVRLAARKELAEAWLQEQSKRVPAADYAAMAYEDYLAHPENYMTEVKLDVTHLLLASKERTAEEALALATQLRARLAADPALFDALVEEYSDDPSKKSNAGKFRKIRHGQMVKPFELAAYALSSPGEISTPVETEFGYHLIRLDRRYAAEVIPFADIKEKAEAQMQAKHIDSYRVSFMQKLLQGPIAFPPGAIEIMARRYFGEDLENAPVFTEDGVKEGTE